MSVSICVHRHQVVRGVTRQHTTSRLYGRYQHHISVAVRVIVDVRVAEIVRVEAGLEPR